jgi:hypothetical protein
MKYPFRLTVEQYTGGRRVEYGHSYESLPEATKAAETYLARPTTKRVTVMVVLAVLDRPRP